MLRLLRDDEIDASEARNVIDETIDAGWYRARICTRRSFDE
ncbi:hypothetical protein [Halalkalicoccus salilacus]